MALFASPAIGETNGFPNYDVTPDGEHFVFTQELVEAEPRREISVVLNWDKELLERVPIP